MTVCYLILAHKYPEQFKKIARHILNSGGVCVAHIDKKANLDDFYVEGVSYVRERENVRWAGYSAVKATQKMLAQALKEYPEATHYASITGQCYPVRPLREYADFLARPEKSGALLGKLLRSGSRYAKLQAGSVPRIQRL